MLFGTIICKEWSVQKICKSVVCNNNLQANGLKKKTNWKIYKKYSKDQFTKTIINKTNARCLLCLVFLVLLVTLFACLSWHPQNPHPFPPLGGQDLARTHLFCHTFLVSLPSALSWKHSRLSWYLKKKMHYSDFAKAYLHPHLELFDQLCQYLFEMSLPDSYILL